MEIGQIIENSIDTDGLQAPLDAGENSETLEKISPDLPSVQIKIKKPKGTYTCKDCGLRFKYKKALEKHLFVHNRSTTFWCKRCKVYFCTQEEAADHKLERHATKKAQKLRCRVCNIQSFLDENEYWFHITELHKGEAIYVCSECGKRLRTKSELIQHNRSKCGTVKQYKCSVCHQELMTPGSLYTHLRRHSGERAFMCNYCGKQFVTLGQLQVHVRIHTQDKAFKCDVCNKGFCHRQSLITHSTIHTGVKPYQCENCSKSFSCVGNLLKHRKTHADSCGLYPLTSHRVVNPNTKIKVRINTPDSSRLKTFHKRKEIAEKVSAYKKGLGDKSVKDDQEVEQAEGETVNFDLKVDESVSNFEGQIETNEIVVESQVKNETTQDASELKCNFCGKRYVNTRWLKRHEDSHKVSGDCTYKCSCCDAGFKTKEECNAHLKETAHSSTLTCDDCEKIFSNADSLRSHQNTFHKGLPRKTYTYICEKCGGQFRQKARLEEHKQSECGESPMFKCSQCEKNFTNAYTLKTHLSVHDPKKKYLCKFCGKCFRWKGQLKIHERSHTGEKPFKCLYCPKAFPYRESLLTHSSLHTGIKPHLCQACGSRFSCIGNLIKHRVTHASTCGAWYSKSQGN